MLAVVQLDAVSLPVLERLLADGRLPALAALREQGRWERLETPADVLPAATYPTLYSGLDPGDHGRYYALQWSPREQRVRFRAAFPPPLTAWERASAAGRRVVVVDPYELEAPRAIEGVAISGWQFRNVLSLERWSVPDGAGRTLERRFGRGPLVQEVFGEPSSRSLRNARRGLLAGAERPVDAALAAIAGGGVDLLWVTLLAGHLGGHLFWDVSQLPAGAVDEATRRELEPTLPELYEALDRALARLVDALPEDCDLLVLSPMGMGPNATIVDVLPGMLEAVLDGRGPRRRRAGETLVWRMRAAVPTDLRAASARVLGGTATRGITARLSTAGLDWSRTRAFMVPSDHHGQVRFNVRGREREGIVAEREVDDLVEELREGLLSFVHENGTPAVAAVERTADVVSGTELAHLLPDLIVRWSDRLSSQVGTLHSERFGELPRAGHGSGRSGAHTADAWLLTLGRAHRPRTLGRAPSVTDVAVTACAVLDVDPGRLRGGALLE